MNILVTTTPTSPNATLEAGGQTYPCLIGRTGAKPASDKREGDGATPLGTWKVLYGLYRADRVAKPQGNLLWRPLREDDGWCDASDDPLYNQWVPAGYPASHETLWRDDTAYDYILVLNHNQPPQLSMGSAVFVHVWHPGKTHTAGCVALKVEDMHTLLPHMDDATTFEIVHV